MIITIYYIVAEFSAPAIYNYWAVLGCDIFLVVMWLASFALLASEVGTLMAYYSLDGVTNTWASILAAAAGLGGVELYVFLLCPKYHDSNDIES